MPIAAIASAVAAKKALGNIIDDIYDLGKTQFGQQIKRWKTKSKIETLYKKIKHVRKVKTVWQVEKEVDLLFKFYGIKIHNITKYTDYIYISITILHQLTSAIIGRTTPGTNPY